MGYELWGPTGGQFDPRRALSGSVVGFLLRVYCTACVGDYLGSL